MCLNLLVGILGISAGKILNKNIKLQLDCGSDLSIINVHT